MKTAFLLATALNGATALVAPAWTYDSSVEAPAGEKSMGSYTIAVYTAEQQARLGVDESGNAVEAFVSEFSAFKTQFQKRYETVDEEKRRFKIFQTNMAQAAADNDEAGEEIFGASKFADLTVEEFKNQYLSGYSTKSPTSLRDVTEVTQPSILTPPTSVDWREKQAGVVSAVKNQGNCGSCWAYSATEEIESMWVLAGNDPVDLSAQQIISCDKTDLGCNGGDTITAYAYVKKAGGIAPEKVYKDTSFKSGRTGKCLTKDVKELVGAVKSHTFATPECDRGSCNDQNEDLLAANVAETGPASICVNAEKWQLYVKGIMTSKHCGKHTAASLDHCVQLVGYQDYGEDDGYWIVRNSWADDWGVDGYIHLGLGDNSCGVANEATFVQF